MTSKIHKFVRMLSNTRLRFAFLLAVPALLWACYPDSQVSYSNPQDTSVQSVDDRAKDWSSESSVNHALLAKARR